MEQAIIVKIGELGGKDQKATRNGEIL